jgi:putative ABC transport system permease protein
MQAKGNIAVEIICETLRDVRIVKGRGVLALSGIAIGTAAVIAMLHVGHNARQAALDQFNTLGTDLVTMQPQASGNVTLPRIDIADVLELPKRNIGLWAISAIVQTGGTIRSGRIDVQASVLGATDNIYTLGNAYLDRGRATSDLDGFAPFAVLGAGIAADIQAGRVAPVAIGDRISFAGQVFTVIGVLKDTPSNFVLNIEFNRSVIVPFSAARRIVQDPSITSIGGRLSPGVSDVAAAEAVADYFRSRMAGGFMQVTTARQMIASIEEQMRIYAALILSIGAVSLVVGGVGIMKRRFDQGSKDRAGLEAGRNKAASVSKLAREHGVNANLVWKWIRKHSQAHPLSPSSTSAFIPVRVGASSSEFDIEMPARDCEERLPAAVRSGRLSSPARVSASLPNGVRLTLECNDLSGSTAIIGALGHVQTGR